MLRRVALVMAVVAACGGVMLMAGCVEERVIYDGTVETRMRQSMMPTTPQTQAGWANGGGNQTSSDGK